MFRRLRTYLLVLFAIVAGVGLPASSHAREPTELAPPLRAGTPPRPVTSAPKAPAAVVPRDVPLIAPGAELVIPPLPPSYVTKDLGWLELSYPPAATERVASILEDAATVKASIARSLGQPVLSRVHVRVAPTVADMARLAPSNAPPPAYASGVAYHGIHLVLLSMLAPRGAEAVDLDEVFRHELAHVALEDALQGRHVPVWFNEGLAIALSGEPTIARTKTLWDATLSDTLIPLPDLDRSFPEDNFEVSIAYAESADFMRFLTRKADQLRFESMIGRLRDGQAFDRAVLDAYGSDLHRLELEWRSELERRFSILPVLTGGGLVWVLVIVALFAAYVRRRRRAKAILARWEKEEAIEDARLAARLAAERAERAAADSATSDGVGPYSKVAAVVSIKVEQDGGWHTLH